MASVSGIDLTGVRPKLEEDISPSGDGLNSWMMVLLTLIFVGLYWAALVGWLRPLSDITMITRLEPIIFVIIGYYFGRLPAQQNERTFKEEIHRHIKRSDAGQFAKEQAEKDRDVIEERLRNVKVALLTQPTPDTEKSRADDMSNNGSPGEREASSVARSHSVETALKILAS